MKCANTRISVTSVDQNVSIIFVNNTVWHRQLFMKTWYSSKSFSILTIFLVWFLELNFPNTPGDKMHQYPQVVYYFLIHLAWSKVLVPTLLIFVVTTVVVNKLLVSGILLSTSQIFVFKTVAVTKPLASFFFNQHFHFFL